MGSLFTEAVHHHIHLPANTTNLYHRLLALSAATPTTEVMPVGDAKGPQRKTTLYAYLLQLLSRMTTFGDDRHRLAAALVTWLRMDRILLNLRNQAMMVERLLNQSMIAGRLLNRSTTAEPLRLGAVHQEQRCRRRHPPQHLRHQQAELQIRL